MRKKNDGALRQSIRELGERRLPSKRPNNSAARERKPRTQHVPPVRLQKHGLAKKDSVPNDWHEWLRKSGADNDIGTALPLAMDAPCIKHFSGSDSLPSVLNVYRQSGVSKTRSSHEWAGNIDHAQGWRQAQGVGGDISDRLEQQLKKTKFEYSIRQDRAISSHRRIASYFTTIEQRLISIQSQPPKPFAGRSQSFSDSPLLRAVKTGNVAASTSLGTGATIGPVQADTRKHRRRSQSTLYSEVRNIYRCNTRDCNTSDTACLRVE
ncbi:uncharacterized protein HD556DRAFT_1302845 [Suillus plorans]|uniref:Uncharacterized protein n=1 Tax=Suillus plorans TaxID=116603 RepID=A0A9P7DYT9_9AGAM|nr:uncharacterized protein HD556DRAFT_1302845 [Suillus plorans]KAG1806342.1 hypothetical protein HD556DRAFT_1302845 [Suillus plorans]